MHGTQGQGYRSAELSLFNIEASMFKNSHAERRPLWFVFTVRRSSVGASLWSSISYLLFACPVMAQCVNKARDILCPW